MANRGLARIARTSAAALFVVVAGHGTSGAAHSQSARSELVTRPDLRHDVSAPARPISPVPNRIPPILRTDARKDPDGGQRPPRPSSGWSPTTADPVVQGTDGSAAVPSPNVSFNGMGDVGGYIPPDPNGAAGPHSYLQAINDSIAEYSKSGARLFGPRDVSSLWRGFGGRCQSDGQGDPVVLYDRFADRWLVSDFAFGYGSGDNPVGPFYECVAVSRTEDPSLSWNRYAFLISSTKLPDYPKIGVWTDGYYLTVNQFDPATWAWEGVGVAAFDRSAMLAGGSASMQYLDSPVSSSGLLPANLDGASLPPAGSPEYILGFGGSGLVEYRYAVDWGNPGASTFSGPISISTAPYDTGLCGYARDCVPQPGTSVGLDANGWRLMYPLGYQNYGDHQSLVVSHTVDTGNDHAGVRWYEIRNPGGNPTVVQQGTYAPDADGRFNPSAAMDQSGDLAVGYSVSGNGTFPSIRYAGRLASDPPNTLPQGEGSIVEGHGSQLDLSHRWGDYSSMSIDPQDGCTFWYTNEYYRATGGDWATRIGAFRFPSCDDGPSLSIGDVSVHEGETADLTVTLSQASSQDVSVQYQTVTDTATSSDFADTSGTLTFAPGQTQATISVPVNTDDVTEPNEDFAVLLSNPSGAGIGRSTGTATIEGTGGAQATDRPDGEIKRPSTGFRGRGIFNLTGHLQTQYASARQGRIRRYNIGIRNTGSAPARFHVRGPGSAGWFRVKYRARGHTVTAAVRSGRYTVLVPAHQTRYVKLVVQVLRGAPARLVRSWRVVSSAAGRGHKDAVKAVLRTVR